MKYLTKKSIIWWFLAYTAISLLCVFFSDSQSIKDILSYLWAIVVVTVLPMWLILLPTSQQVFDVWKRLAVILVPATSVIAIWIIYHSWSDWLGVSVALYLSLLYFVYLTVSLVVVGISWWKTRKG